MILQIYSVYDRAVGAHLQPFFARSEGEAIRMLRQAVNQPDTMFYANPSDYTLCHHGEFSDQNGDFTTNPVLNMVNLSSLTTQITQPDLSHLANRQDFEKSMETMFPKKS